VRCQFAVEGPSLQGEALKTPSTHVRRGQLFPPLEGRELQRKAKAALGGTLALSSSRKEPNESNMEPQVERSKSFVWQAIGA
jgi:hypothetical protein